MNIASYCLLMLSRPLTHSRLAAIVLCLTFACAACGTNVSPGVGDNAQFPVRTSQGGLTQDAWQALLKTDAAFAAVAAAQTQPWQIAGTIGAADGTTLTWAEFAPSADAPREQVTAVFRSCPKADGDTPPVCTLGAATYTATSATFTDAAGKAIDGHVPMGAPQAWEWETSTNLDNDNSTIVAGLAGDAAPLDVTTVLAQFNAILAQKRRFVLLSSYGAQMGVDVRDIALSAQASGRFDSIETMEYVRRGDIEKLMPSLTALDTVVWVGAGVQQKPSKASPPTKAIGMNVSRGVFGDQAYYGKIAGPLLDTPPLGGPGLIVLAGQNTFLGDVSDKASLAASWYEPGTRPVVGFSLPLGTPGPDGYPRIAMRDVINATGTFIKRLGDGETLDAAMAEASAGQPFALTSPMASDNRKKWTWTAPSSSFWAKQPSTGKLTIKLNLTKFGHCVEPVETCDIATWKNGKQVTVANGRIELDCANPTFVGPYFTCQNGDTNPMGTKFSVSGVLRGTGANDHLLFLVQAADGGPLGGAVIVADGVLTADGSDVGGGTTTYSFYGMAALSPFIDTDGNCCVVQPSTLTGDSASDFSTLQLHN